MGIEITEEHVDNLIAGLTDEEKAEAENEGFGLGNDLYNHLSDSTREYMDALCVHPHAQRIPFIIGFKRGVSLATA